MLTSSRLPHSVRGFSVVAGLAVAAALAGCESDSTGPDPELPSGTVTIDASSNTSFVYVDLSTGQPVAVSNPSASSAWDLAVRRYEVRLNGGISGPKGLTGVNLANNENATNEQILAFTADNQKAAFDAIGPTSIPAEASFVSERVEANPLSWLTFGPQGPVANALAAWKVKRSSNGGHALFRVIQVTVGGSSQQNATLISATVEWRYQAPNGTLGTKQTTIVPVGTGSVALDFGTGTTGAATGCGWDIRFDPASFAIVPNVACGAGTFPLDAAQSFDGVTTAADASEYGAFLSGRVGVVPFSAALEDKKGPFLYNLAGDNRLSPTFNIYLVKAGNAVFRVQLINYYSAPGASGHITLRYAQIQ
ncbi:MAG: HmuY family protein [Gemmatimonadales bacterium]